jgi:serine/threonine protein kinase/Tol biopolymer transport system component
MAPERQRQIEELYLAAIDLKGDERAALLALASPDVRHKVEAMLAQPAGSKLLDPPALALESETLAATPVAPGTQIGQYRIDSAIGAGGMGVVFRAYDLKLQRPVAIKFLSDDLADAAARRRFQREAQMASSLNHPHILTVYDVGEFEGKQYLATEFVDGGTLRNWAKRQPRSWEDVAELLTGVADGLATAHQAGILHRDIKPDNILVTASGYAKLADFGLAKLEGDFQPADVTRTVTEELTRQGMIVGTIAYMSPEQAAGKTLDARSDMFSFGVVLYEMLAGHRPFTAATNLELLQTVIHGTPAPLTDDIPEPLRVLVSRALEKDPANRYSSMREMVMALRRALRHSSQQPAVPSKRRRKWLAAAGLAAIAVAAAAGGLVFSLRQASSTARLEYTPLTNFTDSAVSPTLSPDGRMLAFIRGASTFQGPGDVYLKLLPDGEPVRLTRDGAVKVGPVNFSRDGSRIAYTLVQNGGPTWSVPVLGGEPAPMLANAEGLSWVDSGAQPPRVMYSAKTGEGIHMGIFTATESRSEQRTVYLPADVSGMAHRSFRSPDGKSVLVVEMNASGWLPCRMVPFDGNSAGRRVGPAPAQCTDAAWSPDGRWMYFAANTGSGYHIWRQRFPKGTPEQVTSGATEEQGISFAPDGKSFVTSVGESQSTLWVHDPERERQITFEGYSYLPTFSADLKRLYYLQRSKANSRFVSGELWETELETGKRQRLLPDFLMEHYDVSPDGRQVIFITAEGSGRAPLWIGAIDGSSSPRRLSDQDCIRALFAPNGDIVFVGGQAGVMFLQSIKADGTGLHKIMPERAVFLYAISPDGKWVAAWIGADVTLYSTADGKAARVCTGCATGGAENRGVTPPLISWSGDGKVLYLFSEWSFHTYSIPLQHDRILPPLPAGGLKFGSVEKSLSGAHLIAQDRAFMSSNPSVYAYPIIAAHRNIYRIPVP